MSRCEGDATQELGCMGALDVIVENPSRPCFTPTKEMLNERYFNCENKNGIEIAAATVDYSV